jgi:NADH-quinone oxidoreductase subunit L
MLKYILIPLLPFTGFLIAGLFGKYLKERAAMVAVSGVFGSFLFAVSALIDVLGGTIIDENLYSWIAIGSLNINVGFQIDQLTAVMLMVVTTLSTYPHLLHRVHARGQGLRPVLRLSGAVHLLHAGPGHGQ